MYRVHRRDLPHSGSSRQFVGADHGGVNISAFLFEAGAGKGPPPHRHPYDEVQFIQAGRALYNVEGMEFEAGAGEIVVVKAGEVHSFKAIGDEDLVQIDIHLNDRFVQENLS